jgi:hypothetical protein
MALEPEDRPVVIADYGSAQGKNSLAPNIKRPEGEGDG